MLRALILYPFRSMILPIRIWGDPILRKKAAAVDRLTPADKKLIQDMFETMEAADGAGLAAPQVGVSKRIFVFRVGDEKHALINPKIVKRAGRSQKRRRLSVDSGRAGRRSNAPNA